MLKKSVLSLAEGASSGVLGPLSDLRAHSLAALRGVRAHVLLYAPRAKEPAALPVEGRVLARLGWAGQTMDLFEHPTRDFVRSFGSSER